MSGVFLSYARFDSELGERIVAGLRDLDVECWWDRDMPGVDWPREIERQIDAMSALVVIWTAASKDSKYVRAEAIPAFDREKLVNVMFGVKEPPLPFNLYNGFQLDGWTGREPHDGWTRLVRTLEAKLVKAGEVKQGQLVAALGRREQGVRRRLTALSEAEEAFAAAKAADGEADAALTSARATLSRAEEQLSQVSAMHAGPNIIRGAQTDLDDAHAGVKAAEGARRAAATELSSASRALARAKRAVETSFVTPPELADEVSDGVGDADAEAAAKADPPSPAATPQPSTGPPAGTSASGPPTAAAAPGAAASMAGAAAHAGSSPSTGPMGGGANPGGASAGGGAGAPSPKSSSPLPLLLGGAAVLVVGVLALAIFSGHHPTPPTNDLGGNSAVADTNVADANVADANAAANAAPPPSTGSLADAFNQIETEMVSQGAVAWEGFAHDSNPPAGEPADWTYQKRVDTTDFTYDTEACDFSYHFKVTVDGKVTNDDDKAGIPLKDVTTIRIANLADVLAMRDAQSGHPTYSSHLQPTIYVVEAIRTNGTLNELDFYSIDTARRVGGLLQDAAQKCGGNPVIHG